MNQSTAAKSDKTEQQADEKPPLWELIPLAEFKPPSSPAPEAVRSGLHDLWRRLRGGETANNGAEPDVEMERPSQRLLDWAAPEPDWATTELAGLETGLRGWLDSEAASVGVQTIVDPPMGLVRERLERWAAEQDYFIITPPTPEQIIADSDEWLGALPLDGGQRLLLPRLERSFLRHHNGLDLLRRLLYRIDRLDPPLLVLCQSWAWPYLCQAVQIDAVLGAPRTPAPFGDEALHRWLGGSAQDASPHPVVFREASNGKTLLEPFTADSAPSSTASAYLKNLAARSRGNPRVAWNIWRSALLASKDRSVEKEAQEEAKEDVGYTLWVRPWEQMHLPDLAGSAKSLDGMLLYTLLLHGGLARHLLTDLLPFSPGQLLERLHRLRVAGVVEESGDVWGPTPVGYPAIRRFLEEEGFLVDAL